MLSDIFSLDELLGNLRIIHKAKSSKEKYELIMISNADGDTVMMPSANRSLYDLYILIDKHLKIAFNKALDDDLTKYRKFIDLKAHDHYIEDTIKKIAKKFGKNQNKKVKKVKSFMRNIISTSDNVLIKEFNDFKLRHILENLIAEEEGLMDNYYISKYLKAYHDINIDFHQILIDSINEYAENVSVDDDGHYPMVEDYGTAQDYFYKIKNRSGSDEYLKGREGENIMLGRLYYREWLNNGLIKFIKKSYRSKREFVDLFAVIFWITFVILIWIVHGITSGIFIGVSIVLILFLLYTMVFRKMRMIKQLKTSFKYENEVLCELTYNEHISIFEWVLRDIKDGD